MMMGERVLLRRKKSSKSWEKRIEEENKPACGRKRSVWKQLTNQWQGGEVRAEGEH